MVHSVKLLLSIGEDETLKLWIIIFQKKPIHQAFKRLEPHVRNCSNKMVKETVPDFRSCVDEASVQLMSFGDESWMHPLRTEAEHDTMWWLSWTPHWSDDDDDDDDNDDNDGDDDDDDDDDNIHTLNHSSLCLSSSAAVTVPLTMTRKLQVTKQVEMLLKVFLNTCININAQQSIHTRKIL